MAKNGNIAALQATGQSIWYDNLSKELIANGSLARYIEQGVTGLTSNPAIFKKSIADSTHYDTDIKGLKGKGVDVIIDELMVRDVAGAADLLRPVYEQSKALDGYASIEVSPDFAHDTAKTVASAKALWAQLGRPNAMIKIPATPAGIPAIAEVLSLGINVNVTLIFSVAVYDQVVEAFLQGLEARAAKGLPVQNIASVASFFVSRVDSIVEKKLAALVAAGTISQAVADGFFGKVGVANSKLAYESFGRWLANPRWLALKAKGAQMQRPLWASTSTKNPKLSATMYVEELAGPQTVNTIPQVTLDAVIQSQGVSYSAKLTQGGEDAKKLLRDLREVGVQFDSCLETLQTEGVALFADAGNELKKAVQAKAAAV